MLEDMRLRNLSVRTQETYLHQVARFAKHFNKSPDILGVEDIRQFQLYLIDQKVSWSVFNQTLCALRFLYGKTLKQDLKIEEIPFPRLPKRLPVVLSQKRSRNCLIVCPIIDAASL